jgi:hypothetical protein
VIAAVNPGLSSPVMLIRTSSSMGAHFSIAFRHYPLITVKQTGIKHYYLEYSYKIWMPGHGVPLDKIGIVTLLHR